jgi:hypothetical protein
MIWIIPAAFFFALGMIEVLLGAFGLPIAFWVLPLLHDQKDHSYVTLP